MDGVHLLSIAFTALRCSPFNHTNIVLLLFAWGASGGLGTSLDPEGQRHHRQGLANTLNINMKCLREPWRPRFSGQSGV